MSNQEETVEKQEQTQEGPAEQAAPEKKTLDFESNELVAMADILALAYKASDVSAARVITHFLDKFGVQFKPKG